jgi:Tol biopolymer transport system component
MTSQLRSERTLTLLLEDLYVGPVSSDYRQEVHAAVRRTRQRPAWTFLERWLPMADITARLAPTPRLPMRALAIALVLLALIAAAAIVYIAGHPTSRPAPPFGVAENGGVVYALDGDIYVGDPATGKSVAITTGPAFDRNPLVSPNGLTVAFLREVGVTPIDKFDLMVANIDGSNAHVISKVQVHDGDPGIWSADSSFILMMDQANDIYRYDVNGNEPVVIAHNAMPRVVLPPNGAQFVYEEMSGPRALGIMNSDGTNRHLIYTIPQNETRDGCDLGSVLASPDGSHITFARRPAGGVDQCRIFIVNVDGTGAHQLSTDTNIVFETDARWSPDGSMIAFDRWNGDTPGQWNIQPLGVVPAAGGATRSLGPTPVADGAAFEWSPDGKSIISIPGTVVGWPPSTTLPNAKATIIDVATGAFTEAPWNASSWPMWQRVGPKR